MNCALKYCLIVVTVLLGAAAAAQGNYVRVVEPLAGSAAEPASDYATARVTVSYYDGLGRAVSTVQAAAGSGECDIADFTGYDSSGRECRKWLPVRTSSCGGDFPAGFKNLATTFHGDSHPFTETIYDGTHFNRPAEVAGPGDDWRQNGATVRSYYFFNTAAAEGWEHPEGLAACDLSCAYFFVDKQGNLRHDYEYAPGALRVTVTLDEDDNCSAMFTDKQGREVLRRQGSFSDYADTYRVYDIYGRLRYVISPEGAKLLTQTDDGLCDIAVTDRYCFVYDYDGRDRCVSKKMPGQEAVYYVYDKLNRVIFSQDGEQRMSGEWSVRKYDKSNRVAVEGRATIAGATRQSLQQQWGDTLLTETFSPDAGYEDALMYTNTCGVPNFTADKAYYYDSYAHWGTLLAMPADASYERGDIHSAMGLTTGTATTDFGGTVFVSINTYDRRGNAVMSAERDCYGQDHLVSTFMAYDHTGNVTAKKRVTQRLSEQQPIETHTEQWQYSYDTWGRLTAAKHRYGSHEWRNLGIYSYDELGRLYDCYYGNNNSNRILHGYNLRGWVTSITGRHFSQSLYYNSSTLGQGHCPLFNGNISGVSEQVTNAAAISRMMSYTEQGFLSDVIAHGDTKYEEHYRYDLNGNVLAITRGGAAGSGTAFDRLSLAYDGNQLLSLTDSATLDLHLGEVAQVVADEYPNAFAWDYNGRLTRDDSRGISSVTYNPLGLPRQIKLDADHDITLTYGSDGIKRGELMREFYTATVMRVNRKTGDTTWVDQRKVRSLQRRFIGDMVTETGRAPRLYNEAGYVDVYNGGDSVCYYYYERDHLGSVRAVVDESGAAVQTAGYYASGIPVAGSLTLSDDRLHTGKQWQQFGGLAWYDNRARWYDPVLARFTTPDPLQEKYPHLSPYTHCANNPYSIIDPTGMIIAYRENGRVYTYHDKDGNDIGFYGEENNKYDGDSDFVKQLEAALAKLNEGFYGNIMVSYISKTEATFYIESTEKDEKNFFRSRTIHWNPNDAEGGLNINNNKKRPSFIGLAHEFGHVIDILTGTTQRDWSSKTWYTEIDGDFKTKDIPQSEKYATAWENLIRQEHKIPLRKYYSDGEFGNRGLLLYKNTNLHLYYTPIPNTIFQSPILIRTRFTKD